jgi:hypothetical protein
MAKQQRSTRFHIAASSVLIALAGLGGGIAKATVSGGSSAPERPVYCYPKSEWAPATDRQRPCVFKLYEDGSAVICQANGRQLPANSGAPFHTGCPRKR